MIGTNALASNAVETARISAAATEQARRVASTSSWHLTSIDALPDANDAARRGFDAPRASAGRQTRERPREPIDTRADASDACMCLARECGVVSARSSVSLLLISVKKNPVTSVLVGTPVVPPRAHAL